MTIILTNNSLILLLGLVVVGLILGFYGCCNTVRKEATPLKYSSSSSSRTPIVIITARKKKKPATINGAVLDETSKHHEGVLEEIIKDEVKDDKDEDEAREQEHDNAQPESMGLPIDNNNNNHQHHQRQQQLQQQLQQTHLWTIFRNPNAGMISISQMINNLYNIATWVNNPLQLFTSTTRKCATFY